MGLQLLTAGVQAKRLSCKSAICLVMRAPGYGQEMGNYATLPMRHPLPFIRVALFVGQGSARIQRDFAGGGGSGGWCVQGGVSWSKTIHLLSGIVFGRSR